jgi:hypothetical protein
MTTLGGFWLQLNTVLLTLAGLVWILRNRHVSLSSLKVLAAFLFFLLYSWGIAWVGPCRDSFPKSFITSAILMFLALVGLEAVRRSTPADWIRMEKTATTAIVVVFLSLALQAIHPAWFSQSQRYTFTHRYSGIYGEPSSVAFSMFPCVAILLVSAERKMRMRGMVALLGFLIFCRSSTLISLIVVWFLYRLVAHRKIRQAAVIAAAMVLFYFIGAIVNYDLYIAPTVSRAQGVAALNDADNLSSLVYVQGWEDSWENLRRTHGLGLGFNMMGCRPLPDVPIRRILYWLGPGMDELNAQNGSILFGKVISETGIFGFFFFAALIVWWIRFEYRIQRYASADDRPALDIQAALIFSFLACSFIRSAGYFNATLLLLIIAVAAAFRWQSKLKLPPTSALSTNSAPTPFIPPSSV